MREIKERALFARAKRFVLKNEGLILHKHKKGNPDYLLNGKLYAYAADQNTKSVIWFVDEKDFIIYCKENNVLKNDEEMEEK